MSERKTNPNDRATLYTNTHTHSHMHIFIATTVGSARDVAHVNTHTQYFVSTWASVRRGEIVLLRECVCNKIQSDSIQSNPIYTPVSCEPSEQESTYESTHSKYTYKINI